MRISTREFLNDELMSNPEYLKYIKTSMKHKIVKELLETIELEKYYTIHLMIDESKAVEGLVETLILNVEQCEEETITLYKVAPIEPLKLIETKSFLKRLKKAIKYLFNKL